MDNTDNPAAAPAQSPDIKTPVTIIEINNQLASLTDVERAEAFYDLAVNGLEVVDDENGVSLIDRTVVLAAIAGWTMERAAKALFDFENKLVAADVAEGKYESGGDKETPPKSGAEFVDWSSSMKTYSELLESLLVMEYNKTPERAAELVKANPDLVTKGILMGNQSLRGLAMHLDDLDAESLS